MSPRRASAAALALALVLSGLLLPGCNGSLSPSDTAPPPRMSNIWPHEDGMQWNFTITFSQYAGLPPASTPPDLPSFEDLYADLSAPVAQDLLETDTGAYSLRLDGDVMTAAGVTAQNLVGVIDAGAGKSRATPTGARQVMDALARVAPGKSLADTRGPSFLATLAFAFEDSGYYGYGDLSRDHSWIQLEGDLSVGSEFAIQLVPMMVDGVWLRGRVWSIRDRVVGGRRWENVLECMYVVDLGTQAVTDDLGAIVGYSRGYWYGTVLYAPTVGPIACDERHVWGPYDSISGPQPGGMDVYRLRR